MDVTWREIHDGNLRWMYENKQNTLWHRIALSPFDQAVNDEILVVMAGLDLVAAAISLLDVQYLVRGARRVERNVTGNLWRVHELVRNSLSK